MHLDRRSHVPLVDQVAAQIRAKVLSGELQANVPLPSIRTLAHRLEVSVITITRAFDILKREGFILAHPRRGFFVNRLPRTRRAGIAEDRLRTQLEPAVVDALSQGLSPTRIRRLLMRLLAARKAES